MVTLPTLLAREAYGSLHFFVANLSGLRRALFPALLQAYEAWLKDQNNARLSGVIARGETHWLASARRLMTCFYANPQEGDARISQMAVGGRQELGM
jgi:hypothetical protein